MWQKEDPLTAYPARLVDGGVCSKEDLDKLQQRVDEIILKAYKKAIDLNISPRANLLVTGNLLDRTMFSNQLETVSHRYSGGHWAVG